MTGRVSIGNLTEVGALHDESERVVSGPRTGREGGGEINTWILVTK